MYQYLDICKKALYTGIKKKNRTGIDHIGYTGDMMQFDLSNGFPAVTTKKLAFKSVIAEMLSFLKGHDNASRFREEGCRVWDANANENKWWLGNPARRGEDDLGRIYGVQARHWLVDGGPNYVDQLRNVYLDLLAGKDNRREIVTHWNPGELHKMALPPCHLLYQFGIQGDKLNLSMYQRSCDLPLGVPFNIAGYSWLLSIMAKITGHEPGIFTYFMHDIHIYENQIPMMVEQLSRQPYELPKLWIAEDIQTLADVEKYSSTADYKLIDYKHHDKIDYPFAV